MKVTSISSLLGSQIKYSYRLMHINKHTVLCNYVQVHQRMHKLSS